MCHRHGIVIPLSWMGFLVAVIWTHKKPEKISIDGGINIRAFLFNFGNNGCFDHGTGPPKLWGFGLLQLCSEGSIIFLSDSANLGRNWRFHRTNRGFEQQKWGVTKRFFEQLGWFQANFRGNPFVTTVIFRLERSTERYFHSYGNIFNVFSWWFLEVWCLYLAKSP